MSQSSIKDVVESQIAENRIIVFSKTYCPYCKKAKGALTDLNQEFFTVELDVNENGSDIQNYLLEKTGQRTVPNIFIGQKHVGGCDDLLAAKSNGSLQKLLAAVSA